MKNGATSSVCWDYEDHATTGVRVHGLDVELR